MTSAEHAAWVAARASIWASVFAGVSAVGVLWAAWIARGAARTWRAVHEHATADACVAAASECLSAVDRVISTRWAFDRMVPPTSREMLVFPTQAYDDAWATWRRFRTAHVVARRYYADRLPEGVPDRIADQLSTLEAWCNTYYGDEPGSAPGVGIALRLAANSKSDGIREAVAAQVDRVAEALKPTPSVPSWGARARAAISKRRGV